MLSCEEVAVLLSQDLDNDLGTLGKLKLRCHLLICSACRILRGQLFLQKQAAQMAGEEESPILDCMEKHTLTEASRQRIKELMRGEENPAE